MGMKLKQLRSGKLAATALDLAHVKMLGAELEFKEDNILATFPDGRTWLFLFSSQEISQAVYDKAQEYFKCS